MRYVRVPAEATIDNPDQPPIWIDIIIGDGDEMIGQHELSGVLGRFTQMDVQFEPFVLGKGDRVDWGSGFDDKPNERFGFLDLRGGRVTVGRLLRLTAPNHGEKFYRIKRLIPSPTQAPFSSAMGPSVG
jgi:hypothetical protein